MTAGGSRISLSSGEAAIVSSNSCVKQRMRGHQMRASRMLFDPARRSSRSDDLNFGGVSVKNIFPFMRGAGGWFPSSAELRAG